MIKVVTQNSDERKQETIQLFKKIKPFLDEGVSYANAVKKFGLKPARRKNGWFKDLIDYGESQGYSYSELKYGNLNRPARKYCKKILHEDNVEMPILTFDNQEWSD